jgi:2-hydroxychromene-2-carboxylate isomerase
VHLRRLVEAGVGKPPELGPRKQANATSDVRHWAEAIGAEISPDARALHKTDTSLALRCALVAKDQGKFREFHYPAYRARWARARDLAQESVLEELIAGAGLDPDTVLARARTPALEKRLTRETGGHRARRLRRARSSSATRCSGATTASSWCASTSRRRRSGSDVQAVRVLVRAQA